jgi:hypothetical protein
MVASSPCCRSSMNYLLKDLLNLYLGAPGSMPLNSALLHLNEQLE